MANPQNIVDKKWKKGQSGNPAGKPPGARNRSTIVRQWLEASGKSGQVVDDLVLAAIAKAMSGDINALKELMDSGYGKVVDKAEIAGKDGGKIEHDVTHHGLPATLEFLEGVKAKRS